MTLLAPCPTCRRHVADEPACPFCSTPLAIRPTASPTLPGRFSRAAVFAGATLVGCSSSSSNEPAPPPPLAPPAAHADAPPTTPPPPPVPDAPTRARVVGRKLTFFGQPLKNSEVALVEPDAPAGAAKGSGGSATTPGRRVTRTDRDGFFAFEDVEPGDYMLESPGAQHAIHLDTGTNHIDFVMPKPEVQHSIPMPYGAPPARYRIV